MGDALRLRRGYWHLDISVKGERIRRSLGTTDRGEAERIAAPYVAAAAAYGSVVIDWNRHVRMARPFAGHWIYRMWSRAKKNAAARGIYFALAVGELREISYRCRGRCEVSGVPLLPDGPRRHPFIPSLDRIDSSDGYRFENCRIVCYLVNMALRDWGEAPLRRVLEHYVVYSGTRKCS